MLGGPRMVMGIQSRFAQHCGHLHIKVGVGLGGGPDGEEQVFGVHRGHAAGGYPGFALRRAFFLDQLAQFGLQQLPQHRGTVQQFVGEYLGAVGPLGG